MANKYSEQLENGSQQFGSISTDKLSIQKASMDMPINKALEGTRLPINTLDSLS